MSTPPLSYYLGLLTSEFQNAPNLKAWLSAVLQVVADMNVCAAGANAAFSVDTAVGVQLDVIGAIIGASRTVPFQPSGGVSPILDDDSFRILIMAKIAQNQWDGSISSLYTLWAQLFPGGRIVVDDQQNMTAIIILSGVFTSIVEDMITNGLIVPRPEGVEYTFSFPTLPIFGFDQNNANVAGFDLGHFV